MQVAFLGPGDTTAPEPLDFEVINDDAFHVSAGLPHYLSQLRPLESLIAFHKGTGNVRGFDDSHE